jgi:hypothetical protein
MRRLFDLSPWIILAKLPPVPVSTRYTSSMPEFIAGE